MSFVSWAVENNRLTVLPTDTVQEINQILDEAIPTGGDCTDKLIHIRYLLGLHSGQTPYDSGD